MSAYPNGYRHLVVEIARRTSLPASELADAFCISESTVRRWITQADVMTRSPRSAEAPTEERGGGQEELLNLRRENRALRYALSYAQWVT